jgi:GT2 family glycosyltransferase
MSPDLVTIIIVTYNSGEVIGDCLDSLGNNLNVIIVDNNSSDNTKEIIARYQHVKLVELDKNYGFGVANNFGLMEVKTNFAFLVNPDTKMSDDVFPKLLDAADKYNNGAIFAPLSVSEAGEVLPMSFKTSLFKREKCRSKFVVPDGDISVDFASGAAMLLRMEYFKEKVFFDPEIFLFYEDDDICLQTIARGYRIVVVSGARILHLTGRSVRPSIKYSFLKSWHMVRSRIYMEKKYQGVLKKTLLQIRIFIKTLAKLLVYCLLFKKSKIIRYAAQSSAVVVSFFR